MKGKDIQVEEAEGKSAEVIAKKVIEDIKKTIKHRKEEVEQAEKKLAEVLEKDIEDIKESDSSHWDWE